MDQSKRFLKDCLAGMKPWRTQSYDIGGYGIDIHYESEAIYAYFHVAISHLALVENSTADYQIYARDHRDLPRPFWSWDNMDNQGNLASVGEVAINYEHWNGILRLFDPADQMAVFWVRELTAIPIWHRSFPFRTLLTRIFEQTPVQPIHSAAVAVQGQAVLLAGASGSGKSSTALASLLYGLDFLGDDFNLIDTNRREIHSLYSIAKLEKHQLQVFPELKKFPRVGDDEKDQIEVAKHFPGQIARKAYLKAVFFPKVMHAATSSITPISAKEALQEVSRSTLELLQGNRMTHFHKLGKMCRSLPCYRLDLSENYKEIVNTLREFLQEDE